MKGKNYANRKPESERPANDFYPTPSCMVKELIESGFFPKNKNIKILDPCCGKYAIGNILRHYGYKNIIEKDLIYGDDFLEKDEDGNYIDFTQYDVIIMNPPFKLFNKFIIKSRYMADKIYSIGKLNFFGTHDRNISGLWNNLQMVLPFDRQIAFDKPETSDGKVECGMMITGWFIWDKCWDGLPQIQVLDMQKYIRGKNDD